MIPTGGAETTPSLIFPQLPLPAVHPGYCALDQGIDFDRVQFLCSNNGDNSGEMREFRLARYSFRDSFCCFICPQLRQRDFT